MPNVILISLGNITKVRDNIAYLILKLFIGEALHKLPIYPRLEVRLLI